MRRNACTGMALAAALLFPARPADARNSAVTGVVKAKGDRSHCSRFPNAYWAFEVGDLPHLPCRPKLKGYLVTLNLWQANQAPPPKGYTIRLWGIDFTPTMLIIPKDAQSYDVTIENQDRFNHRIFTPDADRLGKELVAPNGSRTIRFDQLPPLQDGEVQTFRMRCGFFPHMEGTVAFVRSTAHAIVGPRGHFRIKRVPQGSYVLRLWHRGKKVDERTISVGRRSLRVTIDLLGKKPDPAKGRPGATATRPVGKEARPAAPRPRKPTRRRRRRRRR